MLGILGDVMLRSDYPGLNLTLMVGATAAAIAMLFTRRLRSALSANTWALLGALAFFAAMFSWREAGQLLVADGLAIVGIFAVLALPVLRVRLATAGVSHYILGFASSTIHAWFAPFLLVFSDIKWTFIPQKGWSKAVFSVLRGILIAAPLLLIFGGLFAAADAAFEGLVKRAFNFEADMVFSHIFLTGLLSWLAAGYLRGILIEPLAGPSVLVSVVPKTEPDIVPAPASVTELPSDEPQTKAETGPEKEKKPRDWQTYDNSWLPKGLTLGAVEIGVVLGLVDLLFLIFVIVQVPYLFGGMEFVQNTPDFKLAEFARRGFGELVAVAALVLPILLVSHWLLKKESPVASKLFKVLAGVQIVLLFVIMASAVQRIMLLTGSLGYGMTTTRFYPLVFILWLSIVFVWFALTVLRGARQHFAWGALWSALILLAGLHFFNPDAFIARRNIELMKQGREYDARYNARELSADAVPALLEGLPYMNAEQQQLTRSVLASKTTGDNPMEFRSWNWSRRNAWVLMIEHRASWPQDPHSSIEPAGLSIGDGPPQNNAGGVENVQTLPITDGNNKPVIKIDRGGKLCESYLLRKIVKEKAEGSRIEKLKDFDTENDALASEIKEWLQPIRKGPLKAFELKNEKKKTLILSSIVMGATGKAANFEAWYVQTANRPVEFRSLSENPNLIFWDRNGSLNYYSVDYGSTSLDNGEDWKYTLDLLRYRVGSGGESELVAEERNLQCS